MARAQLKPVSIQDPLDSLLKMIQIGKGIQSILDPDSSEISKTSRRNNILHDVDTYFAGISYDNKYFNERGYDPSIAERDSSKYFENEIANNPDLSSAILRRIKVNSKYLPKQFNEEKKVFTSIDGATKADVKSNIDKVIGSINWDSDKFLGDDGRPKPRCNSAKRS